MPRPQKRRLIENLPEADYFKPAGVPMAGLEEVILNIDELEAIRLKDHEGLNHEESAARMQVSRPTFHRILRSAHGKVAEALTQGKALRIQGGSYRIAGRHQCRACGHTWSAATGDSSTTCPSCDGADVVSGLTKPKGRGRHRHRGPGRAR